MKIFSEPTDWRDLQNKVCLLLRQAGFTAKTEKKVATPQGEVELDVFAIDPNSIDKISYVVYTKVSDTFVQIKGLRAPGRRGRGWLMIDCL